MDIKKIGGQAYQDIQKLSGGSNPTVRTDKEAEQKESGPTRDRVQLTSEYQRIDQAKKVAMSSEEIRPERVEQLRQKVQSGTYPIDAEQVANRMLKEMW